MKKSKKITGVLAAGAITAGIFLSNQPPSEVSMLAVTEVVNVDSMLIVLKDLETERYALPDPSTNTAKRIYAEEMFKYRMIDTLAAIYPVIQNRPDSTKLAKLDSVIAEFAHTDSTDDRGNKTRTRLLKWLELSLAERKQRIKGQRFIGKMVYASRSELIAVVEQFNYAMFDGRPLRQVIKKLAIERLKEGQGNTFTGYAFDTTTEFDNKLATLRGQYFESEVK